MLFLSRPLYVLDHRPQFFAELVVAVIDPVHVGARPSHALDDPTGFFNVLLGHIVQRKLRRVEGHSVATVDSRRCPERYQSFIACGELRIT
jgi:hypothetical protein